LYLSGRFPRNPDYIQLQKNNKPGKKEKITEIDNKISKGAAMVIDDVFAEYDLSKLELGIVD
jgi:hypothetical protein